MATRAARTAGASLAKPILFVSGFRRRRLVCPPIHRDESCTRRSGRKRMDVAMVERESAHPGHRRIRRAGPELVATALTGPVLEDRSGSRWPPGRYGPHPNLYEDRTAARRRWLRAGARR